MNGTSFRSDIRYWLRQGNTINHLLLWNISVFLVLGILRLFSYFGASDRIFYFLYDQLVLHSDPAVFIRKPWGILTYMFAHLNIFHIFFNLLNLYWFGNLFRSFLGNRRVLPLYLLGGIVGGGLYILCFNVLLPAGTDTTMLGASASVMALLVACATLMPDYTIGLLFIGSIKLKWLAMAVIVLDLITIPQGNLGGILAHVGGALLGFVYIKVLQGGADLCQPLIRLFELLSGARNTIGRKPAANRNFKPKKSPLKIVRKAADENQQMKLDQLLDKINEKGISSLSAEEKAWLDKLSKDQ